MTRYRALISYQSATKREIEKSSQKKTSVRHTNGRPLNYVPERNFSFNFFFGHQILKYKSQIRDELTTKTQPAHVYVYITNNTRSPPETTFQQFFFSNKNLRISYS